MDALATGEYVWIGIPAIRLLLGTVVGRFNAPDNEKTAQGATVWIGRNRDALRLFAVCSPVASLASAGLGASWRRRHVRVYVADANDAKRVAAALGCSASSLISPPIGGPATATRRDLTFGGCRPSVAKVCARG